MIDRLPRIHTTHLSNDRNRVSTFAFEFLGLFCLFVAFLIGAVVVSVRLPFLLLSFPTSLSPSTRTYSTPLQTFWGNLLWCHSYWQCRVLTVLVTFSWMTVSTSFVLLAGTFYAITISAIPMEKRYPLPLYATYAPYVRSHKSFESHATLA